MFMKVIKSGELFLYINRKDIKIGKNRLYYLKYQKYIVILYTFDLEIFILKAIACNVYTYLYIYIFFI